MMTFHIKLLVAPTVAAPAQSADQWRNGDLAVCLSSSWYIQCGCCPAEHDLLRVKLIRQFVFMDRPLVALGFEGRAADHLWLAAGFRKVEPDRSAATSAEAWIEKIRQRQPVEA